MKYHLKKHSVLLLALVLVSGCVSNSREKASLLPGNFLPDGFEVYGHWLPGADRNGQDIIQSIVPIGGQNLSRVSSAAFAIDKSTDSRFVAAVKGNWSALSLSFYLATSRTWKKDGTHYYSEKDNVWLFRTKHILLLSSYKYMPDSYPCSDTSNRPDNSPFSGENNNHFFFDLYIQATALPLEMRNLPVDSVAFSLYTRDTLELVQISISFPDTRTLRAISPLAKRTLMLFLGRDTMLDSVSASDLNSLIISDIIIDHTILVEQFLPLVFTGFNMIGIQ